MNEKHLGPLHFRLAQTSYWLSQTQKTFAVNEKHLRPLHFSFDTNELLKRKGWPQMKLSCDAQLLIRCSTTVFESVPWIDNHLYLYELYRAKIPYMYVCISINDLILT